MKKLYVKPQVCFEDFELSANIAAGCGKNANLPSRDSCGVDIPGIGTVFFDSMSVCTYKGADGDFSICYHNPSDLENLFNS